METGAESPTPGQADQDAAIGFYRSFAGSEEKTVPDFNRPTIEESGI